MIEPARQSVAMCAEPPTILRALAEVADRYDAILCDVWGVIHDGRRSYSAAVEALVEVNRAKPVVLISNSPRPAADVVAQLRELGVPDAAWSGFVTSGDATRAALAERAPGPVWMIGPERDLVLLDGLDLAIADEPRAQLICCTGLIDDEREAPEDYRAALAPAAERGLLMICANPDRMVQRGDQLIWCAGALADIYTSLGGDVLIAGKPAAPIYDLTLAEAARHLGRAPDRSRILCIGDGLITDVAGANAQALDLLYIADGVNGAEALDHGRLDPERLATFLADAGAQAQWAMPALA